MSNLLDDAKHFSAPDFDLEYCSEEECGEEAEEEFKGKPICKHCLNRVLSYGPKIKESRETY